MSDKYDLDEEDFYDDDDLPTTSRWKLVGMGIAAVVVIGFGIGIWYAYDQGVKKGVRLTPPIIKADTSPVKKEPEQKGGMDIPHQDKKVFNVMETEKSEEKVEKLMAPPEKAVREAPPVDITENKSENAGKAEGAAETLMKKGEETAKEVTRTVENVTANATRKVDAVEPSKADDAAAAIEKLEEDTKPAKEKVESTVKKAEVPAKRADVVKKEEKPETTPKAVAAKPEKPAALPKKTATGAVNFRVQLGAFRSVDAAERAWERLQKKHASLLTDVPHRVQSVEITGKGLFHRLQAGAFEARNGAANLCENLKAAKQDCLVAKN